MSELMTDALEDRLVGAEKSRFHFHLALCPCCKRHKRQLEMTIATLRHVPQPEAKDEAREAALAAFRAKAKPGV